MIIKNGDQVELTENKTIMECAHEHAEEELKPKYLFAKINQIWSLKINILTYETVGLDRTTATNCGKKTKNKTCCSGIL